ncbi:MAG: DUF1592 domain-containing protein [Planctomycetaceae bacterium]
MAAATMAATRKVSRAILLAAAAAQALVAAEPPAPPRARAACRRLNRREHENVLRDLLDLPGLDVRDLLPEDGRAHGFDRCAAGLDVSPVHVAAWREAAAEAIRIATVSEGAPLKPAVERLLPGAQEFFQLALLEGDAVFLRGGRYDSAALPLVSGSLAHSLAHYEGTGLFPYRHSVGVFRRQGPGDHFALFFNTFTARQTGRYRLTLSAWSFHWDRGAVGPAPAPEAVTLHANDRLLGTFDAPSLEPRSHTIEAWLDAGDRILFTAATIPPERVWQRPGRAAGYVGPGVAIDHLDVEGPLVESWPPPGHRLLHGAGPRTDPRQVLTAFLARAFRRPATAAEVSRYTALVNRRLKAGDRPDVALHAAEEAALCSAEFVFLGGPPGPLDDWNLAARLASFLWDSMPDEELFALARRGRLRDPDVLRAQVDRLLDDPKSRRFVEHFTDEWLDLREIDATTPDASLHPEYSPHLRDSMLAETRAFVAELLARDEPVTSLVDARFAMVNQRLAEHYGLEPMDVPVRGSAIRRVSLPADSPRGGLLGQASVLKVTANGTVTSPVKRGAWVLREILADPPEPPPAGTPALDPDVRGAVTIREQLARHAADATCAACHAAIDPPGFALESFDVIGGWRERHRVPPVAGTETPVEGPPVDASGVLPDGRGFASFAEFRRLLAVDRRVLARALARHLVVYATGADVTDADRAELDALVDRAAARNHGVRTLVHEVVASRLFREQ